MRIHNRPLFASVRACLVRALALLPLLAAAPLHAQDDTEPWVIFTPSGGTYTSAPVSVTVRFSDNVSLNTGTRSIVLNDTVITGQFTHSSVTTQGGNVTTTSTATITLKPGTNTLAASICDNAGNCSFPSATTYTYNAGRAEVQVLPDGATIPAAAGTIQVHTFGVHNPGTLAGTYRLRAECRDAWTGAPQSPCTASASPVTIPAGSYVQATVTVPNVAEGRALVVRMVAELEGMPGVSDAGWVDVNVATYIPGSAHVAPLAQAVPLTPGTVIERSECVTVAVGPGAAYECGDLRIAHALPQHGTYNRGWAPVLLYNSEHAHPRPIMYADVTIPGTAALPNTVQLTLTVDGVTWSASFPGSQFAQGVPRRLAVQWNATGWTTGLRSYSMQVTSHYSSGSYAATPITGEVAVVDRNASVFGAGWWLAGWERLLAQTSSRFLWVGGDGSTRVFTPVSATEWRAQNPDGAPDTLRIINGVYTRLLNGGGKIEYDGSGRHLRTINRVGQTTHFFLNAAGRVDSIHAPVPAGRTARKWVFTYGDTYLNQVRASAPATTDRYVTLGHAFNDGQVTSITDPDGVVTSFAQTEQAGIVNGITDRRGTRHAFGYDAGWKLDTARVWMSSASAPGGSDIIRAFQAGESRGIGSSVSIGQAHTWMDGPRTDVADQTIIWIGAWGAPHRVRDALGGETVLTRGDASFPSLVTEVRASNARGDSLVLRSSSAYDAKGRVSSTTVHDPLGDGANATTSYAYDDRWNTPVSITAPGVGVASMEYDASGNKVWQQQGDATRRVYFDYNTAGQVIRVRHPHPTTGAAGGGGRDSLVYDAIGNLKQTVSPLGFVTLVFRDGVGRVTETRSPVHASSSSDSASVANTGLRQTIAYDAMGRDTLSVTYGRAMTLGRQSTLSTVSSTAAETVTVRTEYDAGGLPLVKERWATPDTARVGRLTTRYTYDRAGRKLTETDDVDPAESYTYDGAGNMTVHTTRRSHQVTMAYDALGRMIRRATPSVTYAASSVNCSDPAGLNTWQGCSFTFPSFSNNGSGGWTIPADTARFSFDAAGAMVRAENGDAIVSRTYYPGGALRTDTLRIRAYGSGDFTLHVYGVEYRYDAAGRMRALLHPGNLAGSAQRDSFAYHPVTGALQLVKGRTTLEFGYGYDLLGRLTSETMPGGGGNTYAYDLAGRRTSRSGVYGETFTYDARGKVLSVTIPGMSTFRNYYSGMGNLVATEWDNDNNAAEEVEEFRLDALGHQVWRRSASPENGGNNPEYVTRYNDGTSRVDRIEWTLPPQYINQTMFKPDTTFRAYDAAGNVSSGWERGWNNSQGTGYRKVYTRSYYGADDRLRAQQGYHELGGMYFTGERRGYFAEYRYDALGRRVLVRTRRDGLCNTTQTSTVDCTSGIERFVWAGDNILWEMRGPGGNNETSTQLEQVWASGDEYGIVGYTHAGGVDRPLVAYKTLGGNAGAEVVPHMNWRGLFSRGTTSSGAPSTVPVAWPGFATGAYHAMSANQLQTKNWMGSLLEGQRDAGGSMYMRNRYYDPATGQFTQTDPIGIGGGLNTYGFAAGDPVSYTDPYGLEVRFAENEHKLDGIRAWNALYQRARAARLSRDPAVRESGRQLLALMIRMQQDPETIYVIDAHPFSGDERRLYGHGYGGEMRGVSRPGRRVWDIGLDVRGPDPVRALTHELGGAEAARYRGNPAHDAASVGAEDNYRAIRGCSARETHANRYAPPCP